MQPLASLSKRFENEQLIKSAELALASFIYPALDCDLRCRNTRHWSDQEILACIYRPIWNCNLNPTSGVIIPPFPLWTQQSLINSITLSIGALTIIWLAAQGFILISLSYFKPKVLPYPLSN